MSTLDTRHRETWDLLPWYVNGTLEGRELEAVSAHVSGCPACRDEVARCRNLAVAVDAWSAADPGPDPARLRRLLERIDAIEAAEAQRGGWQRWLGQLATRIGDVLADTPLAMRWALGAQAALVVVLAAVLLWPGGVANRPAYRTLAGSGEETGRAQAQIRVVFSEDITEREIRALLAGLGGRFIAGPSPAGVYTVGVPATGPGTLDHALGVLRADSKVRLAEPVVSQ